MHLNGAVFLRHADFWAVGGYDERIQTHGWNDDEDLYNLLCYVMHGLGNQLCWPAALGAPHVARPPTGVGAATGPRPTRGRPRHPALEGVGGPGQDKTRCPARGERHAMLKWGCSAPRASHTGHVA